MASKHGQPRIGTTQTGQPIYEPLPAKEPEATDPTVQSQGETRPDALDIRNIALSNGAAADDKKPKESKAERFARLAPKRMDKCLKALAGIKALTGSNYAATTEQGEKMMRALQLAVDQIGAGFDGSTAVKANGFQF